MKRIIGFMILAVLFMSCGPRIYTSKEFTTALSKHRTVAILPADVTMQLRPNQQRAMTADQVSELVSQTGMDIQEKMYGWFLRRSDRFNYTVKFQDVTRTNSLLKAAGISYDDLRTTDRTKLARILGVDAVLQNRAILEKPMSDGAAVAVGVVFGVWGNTNKIQTNIDIHDGRSGDLLWKYQFEVAGSVGTSVTRLVNAQLRNASRKFPYSSRS
jgi:hypothetical protein